MRMPMKSGKLYLRPTTPPKFDVSVACESLAKIEATIRGDELLCYAHWGAVNDPKAHVAAEKKQIGEWLDVVSRMRERPIGEIAKYLISNDPLLAEYSSLPEDIRSRELFFIEGSIRGFLEYIQDSE